MELTEKLLVSLAGWPVMKQARALRDAGLVSDATYEPPVLRGRLNEGGKQFGAGLRLRNSIDIENLCPCRDSRTRGIICAHSVAVGLQVLQPAKRRETAAPASPARPAGEATAETPAITLKIEGSLRHVEADISFTYTKPGVTNSAAEVTALTRLLECGFRENKGRAVLEGEEAIVRFFAADLPRLKEKWQVTEGERFQHVTRDLVQIEPQFALREAGDGWLDFHIHYTAGQEAVFSAADLKLLFQKGTAQAKLKSGKIAIADPLLEEDLEQVLRDCNPRQEGGRYRIPAMYRGYVEASLARWKHQETPQPALRAAASDLGPLRARLRPYQIDGAVWLLDKTKARTAGLLADEMGLGKTVQTLAMIETLLDPAGPALVVCPSSLVWNWKREAQTFLPDLPVLTLDGPQREKRFAEIPQHRLIVTSYALLRRDIALYRGLEFSAVILDEAQHIKNPDSQNAKAACAIRASSRFILTGTPIENSLRDLWSLFEFLLPGYLGSRQDFRDQYETPLLAGSAPAIWDRLVRRIKPFLLRRRKQDILTELPDKIEQVIEVELSDEQKTAYTQLQQAARAQVDELRQSGSGGAARMRVLTALLRLRQACCDLRLLGAEKSSSGKLNALMELLGEAIDGGHRVLVFSQFTSMLDLIEEELKEVGTSYCRLDGSTRNRQEVVERFQNDETVPVFLISLKAGGVGLNLTAADTVIHFDPWWNPAVEAQATDRAHRIGQHRVVTSIKLIARDTVEERVLKMQDKKRELLENTLDAEAVLSQLDDSDLADLIG